MTGVTFKVCADVVITKSIIMTALKGKGVGANKVLSWGARPAGQTCV